MMRVLIFSIILGACYVLAEKSELATTTEVPKKKYTTENRLLTNIARAKNSTQLSPVNGDDEEPTKTDKKPRTVIHRDSNLETRDNSSCCGIRYSGTSGAARPDHNYNRIPLETGRYPSQYSEHRHHIDRYGWQTRSPGPTGSGGGRPGGGGGYGASGNGVYAGNQSGDRYVPRPVYGSESAHRPNALGYGPGNVGGYGTSGYGGNGRPTGYGGGGGYGITGTLADGDEFGPSEVHPEGSVPQLPGANIQTQKAIALKALAGVALIGAAAALASNPILVPIGIVTGRRKRSESFAEDEPTDVQMDYILNMLKENLAKIQKHGSSNRLFVSPRCVARLTCEIQKDYLYHLGKDVEIVRDVRKQYFTNLLQNNVLNTAVVSPNVKNMIKVAVDVAAENRSCDVFSCTYLRKG